LPAGLVERINATERKVYVDCTKDQIEDAPRYDQAVTDHVDYRERLGSYYSGTYMPPGGSAVGVTDRSSTRLRMSRSNRFSTQSLRDREIPGQPTSGPLCVRIQNAADKMARDP
jgi:hypothetical protein